MCTTFLHAGGFRVWALLPMAWVVQKQEDIAKLSQVKAPVGLSSIMIAVRITMKHELYMSNHVSNIAFWFGYFQLCV